MKMLKLFLVTGFMLAAVGARAETTIRNLIYFDAEFTLPGEVDKKEVYIESLDRLPRTLVSDVTAQDPGCSRGNDDPIDACDVPVGQVREDVIKATVIYRAYVTKSPKHPENKYAISGRYVVHFHASDFPAGALENLPKIGVFGKNQKANAKYANDLVKIEVIPPSAGQAKTLNPINRVRLSVNRNWQASADTAGE